MKKQIAAGFAAAVVVAAGMLASRPAAAAIQVMPSGMVTDASFVRTSVWVVPATRTMAVIADRTSSTDQLVYRRHRHHHHGGLLGIHIHI